MSVNNLTEEFKTLLLNQFEAAKSRCELKKIEYDHIKKTYDKINEDFDSLKEECLSLKILIQRLGVIKS